MGFYSALVGPLLFRFPPERAQKIAELALGMTPLWKAAGPLLRVSDRRLRVTIAGITISNPVGLAAGYDKDGLMVGRLANLGFGYIVAGTVVRDPRSGNPSPRLLRNPGKGALINSLGFPSQGLNRVVDNLQGLNTEKTPLIASISGLSVEEFSYCLDVLQPLVSGLELNISSPNTEGIRIFQEPDKLDELLSALSSIKQKPLFLKLPPYFDDSQKRRVMELVDICLKNSVEGVTTGNTWPVDDPRLAVGKGGLSGKPLLHHMLRAVKEIRSHAGDDLIINACGGVFSGEDALSALQAGANTVQIFTGFVYGGPATMKMINQDILSFMEREGIGSIREIAGR